MKNLNFFIDLFMHLDTHLSAITNEYGLLIYFLLFAIVFCETGLVIIPFLPGDSLIFATGAMAASGSLNLVIILVVLCLAAVTGDAVNYHIGHFLRNRVASHKKCGLLNRNILIVHTYSLKNMV